MCPPAFIGPTRVVRQSLAREEVRPLDRTVSFVDEANHPWVVPTHRLNLRARPPSAGGSDSGAGWSRSAPRRAHVCRRTPAGSTRPCGWATWRSGSVPQMSRATRRPDSSACTRCTSATPSISSGTTRPTVSTGSTKCSPSDSRASSGSHSASRAPKAPTSSACANRARSGIPANNTTGRRAPASRARATPRPAASAKLRTSSVSPSSVPVPEKIKRPPGHVRRDEKRRSVSKAPIHRRRLLHRHARSG